MDYKKYVVGGLVLAFILSVGLFFVVMKARSGPVSLGSARLEIEGDGYKRAFEGEVVENMTVFEALQASALAGNITFNYEISNGSVVVRSLDGYDADGDANALTIQLNSHPVAAEEIHLIPIRPGDIISIKTE